MERESKMEQQGLDSIKIYCRFAPSHGDAKELNHSMRENREGSTVMVRDDYNGSSLEMDCEVAFDGTTSQERVHEEVTEPLIPSLLQGYNCTLLAFGQTASGKTHTMLGPQGGRYDFLRKDQNCGIVPRAVLSLFHHLEASQLQADVDFSYFEIYNEVVCDLIAKATCMDGNVKNFEFKGTDKARFEREVSRVRVRTADEFLHILEATNANRQQGGTDQNNHSSRSHSVVLLRVHTGTTSATMCMVDLAGSECIKKSNAQGMRRYETKNINTSLFALKQVIHALYKRKEHIPYADSMLTRTLSDSLSGNSFLRILVCCTARAADVQETMTTLRFAKEASCVVRKAPVINRYDDRPISSYSAAEIESLAKEKSNLSDMNNEMTRENDNLKNESAVLQMQVRQLQDTNTQLITQIHQSSENYQNQVSSLQSTNHQLQIQTGELQEEERRTSEKNVYLSRKVAEVQKHMDGILTQINKVTLENDMLRNELRQSRSTVEQLRQQMTQQKEQQEQQHAAVTAVTQPKRHLQQEVDRCQTLSEELIRLKNNDTNVIKSDQPTPDTTTTTTTDISTSEPLISLAEPLITAESDALTARLQRLEQVC